jgi:hypothetical protein
MRIFRGWFNKMATMLEDSTTEEQRSVVRFLWAKGLDAKDIHKPLEAVHNWVADVSLMTKRLKLRCESD